MAKSLVSIDLGTTRLKVAAFATDGTLQHVVELRHEDLTDAYGQYQDANRWWRDCLTALAELSRHIEPKQVLGVGISGRGGAGVFTNRRDEVVVHPWFGDRHADLTARLTDELPQLPRVAIHLLAKHEWAKTHLEEDVKRAFYAKDWILFKLTGAHLTDWSSGPDKASWKPAPATLDLPAGLLPEPRLPWEIAGPLRSDIASMLGYSTEVQVGVGAHDGLAANIGSAATSPGDYVITVGTHAIVRCTMAVAPAGAYRFYSFPPDRVIVGANALWAGRAADWFADCTASELGLLEREASQVPPGADGVTFLPYLGGQIAPLRNPGLTASFGGLTLQHGRGHMYRSVVEGAAFAVKEIFEQVGNWCGTPNTIGVTGGASRSTLWMNTLAAVLGRAITISDGCVEARGAAMCLAVGLGLYDSIDDAARSMVLNTRTIEPPVSCVANYQQVYGQWSARRDREESL